MTTGSLAIAKKPAAISGVAANFEGHITTAYPSVAATGLGCLIGQLMNCIPPRILGVRISQLLFALPLAPLGALLYVGMKVLGSRYVLTNRSLQKFTSLGNQRLGNVNLTDITEIHITHKPGYDYHRAGDLEVYGKNGDLLFVVPGIVYPKVFRQTILEARDARVLTNSSLQTIQARK